jgi:hypothetical protein
MWNKKYWKSSVVETEKMEHHKFVKGKAIPLQAWTGL